MVSFLRFIREQRTTLPDVPNEDDCKGHTYIVTGANTGLGFECAQHLVRLKANKVILACRSISRGEAAKKRIEDSTRRPGVAEVWQLDIGSYDSVKAFACQAAKLERIDAVVENASIATLSYEEAEGLESTLTVNVVGTFLLAALLLPHLQQVAEKYSIQPRLVVVGSEVALGEEGSLEKVDGDLLDGLSERGKTSMSGRYPVSKLLQLYAVREFARCLSECGSEVVMNIVNPGLCKTDLSRNVGPLLQMLFTIIKALIARTAEMGSRTLLHATFAGTESHGKYLSACQVQNDILPVWITGDAGHSMQKRVWESLNAKLEMIEPGCVRRCLQERRGDVAKTT